MYLAVEDDSLIDGSGWNPEEGIIETEWYKQGQENEDFVCGTPYQDELTLQID